MLILSDDHRLGVVATHLTEKGNDIVYLMEVPEGVTPEAMANARLETSLGNTDQDFLIYLYLPTTSPLIVVVLRIWVSGSRDLGPCQTNQATMS